MHDPILKENRTNLLIVTQSLKFQIIFSDFPPVYLSSVKEIEMFGLLTVRNPNYIFDICDSVCCLYVVFLYSLDTLKTIPSNHIHFKISTCVAIGFGHCVNFYVTGLTS
jgi:hypothetical protein